jgi:peptidoglycan/LPS O-acetylase OafA/YrhL
MPTEGTGIPPSSLEPPPHHFARIDVLRAVAILLVFSQHFVTAVFGSTTYSWVGNWYHWSDSPSVGQEALTLSLFDGTLGVTLFFVISGLCIRLSHLSAKSFSLRHFYWRRFWRIYPPYLLALGLFILWQHNQDLEDILLHLFLLHNFSLTSYTSINAPFWSLALEFQVYLLYPVLLALHHRLGVWRCGILLALLSGPPEFLGGETFRAYFHLPVSTELIRQMPIVLWFAWYMGFLLAEALVKGIAPGVASRTLLVLALILHPLVNLYRPFLAFRSPIEGLLLALLAFEYLNGRSLLPNARRVWACIGICSYSFYLYFDQLIGPCLGAIKAWTALPSTNALFAIGYPLTFFAIFAFSYLMYRAIELPGMALGRFLYARQGQRA